MSIWHIFEIDECFTPEIRLIIVPFDSRHAVLEEVFHSFWDSIVIIFTSLLREVKGCVVFEEGCEFLVLVALSELGVSFVVLAWSELRNHVDHIVEAKLAHVVVEAHSVLDDLQLYLKHRHRVVPYELDVFRDQNDNVGKVQVSILLLIVVHEFVMSVFKPIFINHFRLHLLKLFHFMVLFKQHFFFLLV